MMREFSNGQFLDLSRTSEYHPAGVQRVTLIAAWRTKDGIVIHADSQETWGHYRVDVTKIRPETIGKFEMIIAGAGRPGPLVDGFALRLKESLSNEENSPQTLEDLRLAIQSLLVAFHQNDFKVCPGSDDEKEVRYIIVARDWQSTQYDAWITKLHFLFPISDFEPELIGIDEPLYKKIAKRFSRTDMSIQQAILAGVYVMKIAEDTSNYVKSPFLTALVNSTGISLLDQHYVEQMQIRLRKYEELVNGVLLASADTTLHLSTLDELLAVFRNAVLSLHQDHINDVVRSMRDGHDPWPHLPNESMVTVGRGGPHFVHNLKERKDGIETYKGVVNGLYTQPHPASCAKCRVELEYMVELRTKGPSRFPCPTGCGSQIEVPNGRANQVRKGGDTDWMFITYGG
jgi:hypothetical protein